MHYNEILQVAGNPLVLPMDETAKMLNGAAFPPSFLAYGRELGYGLLCRLVIVYLPYAGEFEQHPDSWFIQSRKIKAIFEYYLDEMINVLEDDPAYPQLIAHGIPFARTENGEFLFWDGSKKQDNGELPIYFTDFSTGIYHAGDSLYEFIANVTSAQHFKSVLRFTSQPLPATFKPYQQIVW